MRRPFAGRRRFAALLARRGAARARDRISGPGSNQGIPQNLAGRGDGNNVLTAAVGAGSVAPTDIIIDTGRRGWSSAAPETHAATAPADRRAASRSGGAAGSTTGRGPQYVDASVRYLHFRVIGKHEYGVPAAQRFVHRLRDHLVPRRAFPADERVFAGGGPP